jgi:DNA-binding LacI/PurR family transcriptional regulator
MPANHVPPSIKDVAEACGVSRRTVSAILFPSAKNKAIGFSETTRDHVVSVSKKLRYRPHRGSRNLLVRRQGVIGILTGQFFMIPWPSINAMLIEAKTCDQILSFEYLCPDALELPLFIRENVVDGLIIYERVAAAIEQAIEFHHIPTVYVNTCRHTGSNLINMDEIGAMTMAVEHLVSMRLRRPAIILLDGSAPLEQERIQALRAACRNSKLERPLILDLPEWSANRQQSQAKLEEFLTANTACDSMIAPHGGVVSTVYKSCRRLGRRIPDDLAVISMQDAEMLLDFEPQVTAFDLPTHELGTQSVAMLNQVLHGRKVSREVLIPYKLHVRASSGSTSCELVQGRQHKVVPNKRLVTARDRESTAFEAMRNPDHPT